MKKFLCTLLCLMLVFTMMPMATGVAWAAGDGSSEENAWEIGSNVKAWISGTDTLVISGTNAMQDFTDGNSQPWTSKTNIKQVIISEEVTSIGNNAFNGFSSLKSITIPASIKTIGESAFEGCSNLATVTFASDSQLNSIGDSSFNCCSNLTSINLASCSRLKIIKSEAFSACVTLKSIEIPASVTSIGKLAFQSCNKLEIVNFASYSQLNTIGVQAFQNCYTLESITIPASVTSIDNKAFAYCSKLKNVTFETGSQLNSIGEKVFLSCGALTSIDIPASVTSIGNGVFNGCDSLATLTVDKENTVYESKDNVLYNKGKTNLIFYPAGKSNTQFLIPDSVGEIGANAFEKNIKLESVTIPASVKAIKDSAFDGCSELATVTFASDSKLATISSYVFNDCKALSEIKIPKSVESIGYGAFQGCTSLTNITIPASTTSIESNAFLGCSQLATVTCLATMPPTLGGDAFHEGGGPISGIAIYVPYESVEAYKSNWSTYTDMIQAIPSTVPEKKPTSSYGGYSAIDYAQYQAILAEAQKQQQELDAKKETEKHEELVEAAKAGLAKTDLKTSSKMSKLNGKAAIKLTWKITGGDYALGEFDGFDIFRSTKKTSGYGKTPYFTTTKTSYTNNKNLKAGKTYYYKVRAYKMVDGEKVYTGWSTKAWRTV